MTQFRELADRVYVLRYPVLDVTVTLVVGDGAALVVDTLSTPDQAAELVDAVRAVTPYPLTIVNTHHHFDHCFGNATLAAAAGAAGEADIWAHEDAAAHLRERGVRWQRQWYEQWLPIEPELAEGLAEAAILPPNRTVRTEATVDVGGRPVRLCHLGRGHTDGDLVVLIPDADVVVAGDLVEESGPPDFGDAYPLEWPETLAALDRLLSPATVVVPGHGTPVDGAFVRAQHALLTRLDWLIRDGHADGAPERAVAARSPFDPDQSLVAVARGYAELSGRA
jgi:glyoxylase-like metal-dependent hydrolase (beta-lactamase superfamily II)